MKRSVVPLFVFLASTPVAWGQDMPSRFENEDPWEWFFKPTAVDVTDGSVLGEGVENRTLTVAFCELKNAKLPPQLLNIADTFPLLIFGADGDSSLRLVAFDENGERLAVAGGGFCSSSGAKLGVQQIRLGDKTLKYLGVERLTPARQKRNAAKAQEKLAKKGIALSFPTEGEAFPYRFGPPKGPAIESKRLLGKVVLIQWWASW